jgi:hypothetical protein
MSNWCTLLHHVLGLLEGDERGAELKKFAKVLLIVFSAGLSRLNTGTVATIHRPRAIGKIVEQTTRKSSGGG